jgi:hypothetical protein
MGPVVDHKDSPIFRALLVQGDQSAFQYGLGTGLECGIEGGVKTARELRTGSIHRLVDMMHKMACIHVQFGRSYFHSLFEDLFVLVLVDQSTLKQSSRELLDRRADGIQTFVQIHSTWPSNQDGQCQHLPAAQRIEVAIKVVSGGLNHAAPLSGIGDLVQIEFQDICL